MIKAGDFVHSLDERDDPNLYYLVLEDGIDHVSGECCKIALPEAPTRFVYRLTAYLRSANAEIAHEVAEARRLAQ